MFLYKNSSRRDSILNGREFYDRIEKHTLLDYLGSKEAMPRKYYPEAQVLVAGLPDRVYVKDSGRGVKHELSVESILSESWEDLEAVLTGNRPAKIMRGITRVVGYYSQVRNWNGSKLAELADRERGRYRVPKQTPDMDQETPQEVLDILAAGGADMSCNIEGASS